MPNQINVINATERNRFEANMGGDIAFAAYRLNGSVLDMYHTYVPPHLEGRGIAAELVEAAIAYAREQRVKIGAACSYVAHYFEQHPEVSDVLAKKSG